MTESKKLPEGLGFIGTTLDQQAMILEALTKYVCPDGEAKTYLSALENVNRMYSAEQIANEITKQT